MTCTENKQQRKKTIWGYENRWQKYIWTNNWQNSRLSYKNSKGELALSWVLRLPWRWLLFFFPLWSDSSPSTIFSLPLRLLSLLLLLELGFSGPGFSASPRFSFISDGGSAPSFFFSCRLFDDLSRGLLWDKLGLVWLPWRTSFMAPERESSLGSGLLFEIGVQARM